MKIPKRGERKFVLVLRFVENCELERQRRARAERGAGAAFEIAAVYGYYN